TETEQDALFDPGVDAPAGGRGGVGLAGASLAGRQRGAQAFDRLARLPSIRGGSRGIQPLDFVRERRHDGTAGVAAAMRRRASARAIRCRDASRGGTSGRRYTSRSSPIAAMAYFTGIG